MKEFNLDMLRSGLVITEAEREEGIILKIDKSAFEDGTFVVRIHLGDEVVDKQKEDDRPTIPGHPNCHVGECFDCHVVSCAIYQGYEDMP